MNHRRLRGLYAVTSESICSSAAALMAAVEQALTGGANLIQYRDKWNDQPTRERNARALKDLCRQHHAWLIINDDVNLAEACGADGVHLGATDAPLAQARRQLGPGSIIGVTCANSLERAQAAAAGGASYVAFGRFFDSRTKPNAPPASLQLLTEARTSLQLPVCAIGGITPENAGSLIQAGADMVAAVEGVFGAANIQAAARSYSALFPR